MAFVKTERLGDTAVEARFLDFVHTLALQDGQEEPEQNAERQAHSREVKGKRELPWQIFLRAARVKPLHCDLRCNFDQRGDCVEEDASDERHPPKHRHGHLVAPRQQGQGLKGLWLPAISR